jgi:hypothetical protein
MDQAAAFQKSRTIYRLKKRRGLMTNSLYSRYSLYAQFLMSYLVHHTLVP